MGKRRDNTSEYETRSTSSSDQRNLVVAGVGLALLAVAVQTALYLADVYALDRRVGTST